jgi:hypothetical protein
MDHPTIQHRGTLDFGHLQAPAAKPTQWEEFVAGPCWLFATGSGFKGTTVPPDLIWFKHEPYNEKRFSSEFL